MALSQAVSRIVSRRPRPSFSLIFIHSLSAMLLVMALVLVGVVARAAYVGIAHPKNGWVEPSNAHPVSLAFGLGLAAGVLEAVFSLTGVRASNCRDYASSGESASLE
jgi:hypothetical protein